MDTLNRIEIQYNAELKPDPSAVADLYIRSGLPRPTEPRKVKNMIDHANVVISAWHGERLVGILRAFTDYSFDCYVNDLAVDRDYQHRGIGRGLVSLLFPMVEKGSAVFLIAAPDAAPFYEKLGFSTFQHGYIKNVE